MGTYGGYVFRHLPELLGLAFAVWIQLHCALWLAESAWAQGSQRRRLAVWAVATLLSLWVIAGVLAHFPRGYRILPSHGVVYWARGSALAWAFASIGAYLVLLAGRRLPKFRPERRGFIRAAGVAAVAAPFAVIGYGMFIQRSAFRLREVTVPIPGLPRDLDGLRIAQLSDIHLSPFLTRSELARAVAMANEARPHLAVVTGDLITAERDPLQECLQELALLRSDAGTLGCMGNHEIYARCLHEAEFIGRSLGIDFLRMQNRVLRFGNAALNIGGVDYQVKNRMLRGAEQLLTPNSTNLLLSHNPNAFDEAVRQGWDLTLAGHTHGGQVTLELLDQSVNAARFFTDYVYGLYQQGPRSIYVTRGIGTVGIPARIGAPPEVALIRLCAT